MKLDRLTVFIVVAVIIIGASQLRADIACPCPIGNGCLSWLVCPRPYTPPTPPPQPKPAPKPKPELGPDLPICDPGQPCPGGGF